MGDQLWIEQNYRYEQSWSKPDICTFCHARNDSGPLDFNRACAFPPRTHEEYMLSDGAAKSPLSKMCGFHRTMTRSEAMHVGPLGALPESAGSAMLELCDEGAFECTDLMPWEDRISAQLAAAHHNFSRWAKHNKQEHTVKAFTRCGFSMYTLNTSFPCLKGKAHNCLVVARWLEAKCAEFRGVSEYAQLRANVMWGWVEFFEVAGNTEDRDFMNATELQRLDSACKLILHGSSKLARINCEAGKARWKTIPKLHQVYHLNDNAQVSHRPPRAFWSFKDEEMMGALSKIACAVHACNISARSLQRWCMQFFSEMQDSE